jgi:hypothetical protein
MIRFERKFPKTDTGYVSDTVSGYRIQPLLKSFRFFSLKSFRVFRFYFWVFKLAALFNESYLKANNKASNKKKLPEKLYA